MNEMTQAPIPLPPFALENPKDLPWTDIALCHSAADARRLCVAKATRRLSWSQLAVHLGYATRGGVSKLLSGQINNPDKIRRLEQVCGNNAPSQYEAWMRGRVTVERELTRDELVEALLAENARLKAERAA